MVSELPYVLPGLRPPPPDFLFSPCRLSSSQMPITIVISRGSQHTQKQIQTYHRSLKSPLRPGCLPGPLPLPLHPWHFDPFAPPGSRPTPSHLRAFALAVPSAWSAVPQISAQPHSQCLACLVLGTVCQTHRDRRTGPGLVWQERHCHHQVALQTHPWAVTSGPASRFVLSAKPRGASRARLCCEAPAASAPPCLLSSGCWQTLSGGIQGAWKKGRLVASQGLCF